MANMTNLNETFYRRGVFLAKAWSDIPVEEFRLEEDTAPSSRKSQSGTIRIIVPSPSFYGAYSFLAYRCWRFSVWHQAMHSKTPESFFNLNVAPSMRAIMSALEDERIEILGKRIWKGMTNEKKLIQSLMWKNLEEVSEPLCSIEIFKLFHSKLTLGKTKGHLSPATERKVDEAATFAKTAISHLLTISDESKIIDGLHSSAERIARILDITENLSYLPATEGLQVLKGAIQQTSDDDISKILQEDFGILKAELERIIEGDETVSFEWAKILEQQEREKQNHSGTGNVEDTATLKLGRVTTINVRQDLVNRLVAALRNWRFNWKEYLSETGDELDDDFLSSKPFIAEDKLQAKARVAILLDHSGSIWPVELTYKEMTAILCQALQKIGIWYALFAFSESPSSSGITVWTIKDVGKPFDKIATDRLLQIDADGGTPLADVYKRLLPALTRWRIQKLVTFTDGVPDSLERASMAIRVLQRKGIQMSAISYRSLDVKRLPYDRFEIIRHMDDLPRVLLGVLVGG